MISGIHEMMKFNVEPHIGHILFVLWLQEDPDRLKSLKRKLLQCNSASDIALYTSVINDTAKKCLTDFHNSFPEILEYAEHITHHELIDILRNNPHN